MIRIFQLLVFNIRPLHIVFKILF